MKTNQQCKVCQKEATKLIISNSFLLPLCLEHEKALESQYGEIEPLTTFNY